MQIENLKFDSNAFSVLGARYSSSAQEIADLVDDVERASSKTEAELHTAQQALVTPRLRLVAEVSWLPELSDAQIAKVLGHLRQTDETSLLQAIANFPDLAKANIIADMATSRSVSNEVLDAYLEAWRWFDPEPTLEFFRATRRQAGFPEPDGKAFLAILPDLKQAHIVSLVRGVMAASDGAAQFGEFLDTEITMGSPSPLLPSLVKEFEKRCERDQSRIADEIREAIESARSGSMTVPMAVSRIGTALKEWDQHTKPVLRFYTWRGHAEPRTKVLFYEVREFLLHLTNVDGKLDDAKKLLLSLDASLAYSEELRKVSDKDLQDLEGLIAEQRQFALFQPLSDACDAAKASHLEFAKIVRASGMTPVARDPVGAFAQALRAYAESGDADLAAAVARDLALFFNNDQQNPEIAYRIIQGANDVLPKFRISAETKARMMEDSETIFRNWKIPEIEKQKGNLSRMTGLVEAAITIAPPGLKPEFESLHLALMAKRRESRTKLVVWAVVLAVIFVPIVAINSNKRPSYSSSSSSTYRPSSSADNSITNASNPSTRPKVTQAEYEDKTETKPTSGPGATLGRSEVRYCIFQGKRLDLLRTMAFTNSAIDKFNELAGDFNLRCSNYRYRQTDMTAVELEASTKNGQFATDATAIAKGW